MKKIFLLYGENKESIKDYELELAKRYLAEQIDEYNLIKFNMQETSIEELLYEANSSGLFSNKKVIIAENSLFFQANKKSKIDYNIDLLITYLSNPNPEYLLIFSVNGEIDNRKKIAKLIKENGELREFKALKDVEIERYIINYFNKHNIAIEKNLARFIIDYSRLDFVSIKSELEKLLLYALEKRVILKEDIEQVVTKSIDYDIFALTNHLFSGKYAALRKILNAFKLKGEEPIFLLALIANQFRVYYKIKILLQENYSQKDIAQRLKLHPYRVQLACEVIYRIELEKLFKAIIICKAYDKKLKSEYIDKYLLFDVFINKIIDYLK